MTEHTPTTSTQRVLITGAAGFLGSHLCDRFVRDGFQVIAMDNLITGDMRNIEHLLALPNFSFVIRTSRSTSTSVAPFITSCILRRPQVPSTTSKFPSKP